MYEIEKNVPLPESRGGGPAKYPWRDMGVGDSFFVPAERAHERYVQRKLSGAAFHISARTGRKFATRREEGGVRVWRIE